MPDIIELDVEQRVFITPHLPAAKHGRLRPFVTLTYAQSLDSMISLGPGLRTTLSGSESKSMTHFLRLHHDAILIGSGTAKADNPSLNCRYPGATLDSQPRPVIVGSSLPSGWIDNCKATQLARDNRAKRPWRVFGGGASSSEEDERQDYIRLGAPDDGHLDWELTLTALSDRGIQSVMIEGGASIINDLLTRPGLVDSIIITIAPTFLGKEGVQVAPAAAQLDGVPHSSADLCEPTWCAFGRDMVLCGRLRQEQR